MSVSSQQVPTSGQYYYNQKSYAQAPSDYSSLGAYNSVSAQYITGPPILSETKVQIVPAYGGVGFAGQRSVNPYSNYYTLGDGYCCGSNTCQKVTQPYYGNVVRDIYQKGCPNQQFLPQYERQCNSQLSVPFRYSSCS